MAENEIDVMIEGLEEAGIDDDGVCVKYRPYQCEVPILVKALKAYKASFSENKMEQVAAMFGKRLAEEFRLKDLNSGNVYVAFFDNYGMRAYVDGFPNSWKPRRDMLVRLIVGEAVIVDE